MIASDSGLTTQLMERVNWIHKLGSELKRLVRTIVASNIAIYRELVSIRSIIATQVHRPLIEEPFVLEDAIGRFAPVHLRLINSWEIFQAVMERRFEGKKGYFKIKRKEYALQILSNGREIDMSLDFEDAFLPGQTVTMSLVFEHDLVGTKPQILAQCPRCNKTSEAATDVDILWYVMRENEGSPPVIAC